jgi:hypothetical protein
MEALEDQKRKLRAILAKAQEGSGATDAEAENALRFARRLMLRHGLTEADLQDPDLSVHERAADREYGQMDQAGIFSKFTTWELVLANAVELVFGTVIMWRGHGKVNGRSESGAIEYDENGDPRQGAKTTWAGPIDEVRAAAALFREWSV